MHKIENENLISIVIDAINGVDGAFENLYKATIKFSYGVASSLLKNEEDIEDALQNSYMYVAKGIRDLKNPESFESWLATIVRHECQKYIKKRKRITDTFSRILSSKELEAISSESIPFDLIEKREVNEEVRKIVENLPDDKRACVVLYYFEGNSLSEIAEILGIPEGTIKSRLYGARKTLEKELKKLQKKYDTLYGISAIPLVVAFLAYQAKNIAVPNAIAEGASVCIAAGGAAAISSGASAASATAGGVATAGATGAAGVAGAAVTTKLVAVVTAAAVVTGGGIATVNYVENKKEIEATIVSAISITEEYKTESSIIEGTEFILTELTSDNSGAEIRQTTRLAISTMPTTATEKTTSFNEISTERTTKETTQSTTRKPTTTVPPTTDAANIYNVSGGIVSKYTGEGGNVSIPSNVGGDIVTAIGTGAFAGNSEISTVSLPSSVTRIGQEAFSDCIKLKSISLPSSLKSIGIGAFYGCASLTSVNIPSGVTSIGDDAFADCNSLEAITIPSSVTSIGDNAFGGCDDLIIKCTEGTAAHIYAAENSIDYELI